MGTFWLSNLYPTPCWQKDRNITFAPHFILYSFIPLIIEMISDLLKTIIDSGIQELFCEKKKFNYVKGKKI